MTKIYFITPAEIKKIRQNISDPLKLCPVLADMFRLNTLSMIFEAGSGHIGTSFSCMDIITWLWTQELKSPNQSEESYSDTFFSSKGHDAPALYSLLIGLEKLDYNLIHKLRRLGGLPGHPDIHTPNIMTNTGSLGMGISKARGMAIANRLAGKKGHFYVLCGDGELQEGQIWESLQPAANGKFAEITIIVDHNKIQSDTWVKDTSDLGHLEEKFRSFGWEVASGDGHDFSALKEIFSRFNAVSDRPQVLIANTVKGKGVSLFEKITTEINGEFYKFHSGAPDEKNYQKASNELLEKINGKLAEMDLEKIEIETCELPPKKFLQNQEKLIDAYGDELAKIAVENNEIVVLDADLMKDCGLASFKKSFPDRFIECGIAEQDMVSVAGGLALRKKIPIVHSFACFLSTRPNEQIYNNATEGTKIIYTGSLAGVLPATPGHSHQSVRDISTLGSVPGLILIEPGNAFETRQAIRWAVNDNKRNTYLRLVSIPCELSFSLPSDYAFIKGRGTKLVNGSSAVLVSYGPILLNEAVKAATILKERGISLAVYNLPWLNDIDSKWLKEEIGKYKAVFTMDDHYTKLGQGTIISSILSQDNCHNKVISFGLNEVPTCGQINEVLAYHKLDSKSIADEIQKLL